MLELIDRYMAQYAGRDSTRVQRLSAWQAMIGEFTLEQVDSDLMHAGRSELQTKPPLVFVGLDHLGAKIFKIKGRAGVKSTATLNRYMVAIAAVFTWAIEQRLTPKGWVHPCRGIKRLPENDGRVRFLDSAERTRLFEAVRESQYLWPAEHYARGPARGDPDGRSYKALPPDPQLPGRPSMGWRIPHR